MPEIFTLTVYCMQNAHSYFFVVIEGGDVAIGLRVLARLSEAVEYIYRYGIQTWMAMPKPFRTGARTKRGNGGAGAWMP